jgi:Holliday junction resolvase RusA-like endonuclease
MMTNGNEEDVVDLTFDSDDGKSGDGDGNIATNSTSNPITRAFTKAVAKRGRGRPRKKAPLFSSHDGSRFEWTMDQLIFSVEGKPVPKRRVGFRLGRYYNPNEAAEKKFAETVGILRDQHGCNGIQFAAGTALSARIEFLFPASMDPSSDYAKLFAAGDVDNLSKFVLDSLKGVAFADDRQVLVLHVSKEFNGTTAIGRTVVTLSRLS